MKSESWKSIYKGLRNDKEKFIEENKLSQFKGKTLSINEIQDIANLLKQTYNVKFSIQAQENQDFDALLKILKKKSKTKYKKHFSNPKPSQGSPVKQLNFSSSSLQDFKARLKHFISAFDLTNKSAEYLEEFLQKCSILVTKSELKSLKNKVKEIEEYLSTSFLYDVFLEWHSESHKSGCLKSKIIETINDYEKMKKSSTSLSEKKNIDLLIYSLKSQLKTVSEKSLENQNKPLLIEKGNLGLSEIFKHYSKQQFLIGKNPTFESIQKNLEVLTLPKFLKFITDFEILQDAALRKSSCPKEIFLKYSDFNKNMSESQFISSMEKIAELYISQIFGDQYSASLTVEEKTRNFYEKMGFHDPRIYTKKLGSFIKSFGSASPRVPETDSSRGCRFDKNKYKNQKMSIDEWKMQRAERKKMEEFGSLERANRKKQSEYIIDSPTFKKKVPKLDLKSLSPISLRSHLKQSSTLRAQEDCTKDSLLKIEEDLKIEEIINYEQDEGINKYLKRNSKYLEKHLSDQILAAPKFPLIFKNSDLQPNKKRPLKHKASRLNYD